MSQEFDEIVRDSMTWFTEGVDVPAGLAARARGHLRMQRRAKLGWVASGTAVAAAGAVFAGVVASGSAPSRPAHQVAQSGGHGALIQTTAVVISRVDRALAKAASSNPVAYTRQTSTGISLDVLVPHGKPVEFHGNVTQTWSRGPLEHLEYLSPAGKVAFGMEIDNSSGKSIQTMISYPQRLWWRGTYQAPTVSAPKLACTLGEITRTPAQWTREVRKLLSCGAAVAGYENVDGIKTIKLRLSSTYKRACVATSGQSKCTPVPVGWTGVLWANASTYKPVRLVSHGHHYSFKIDFRWLTPNAASLALLHQPIPTGFRHV